MTFNKNSIFFSLFTAILLIFSLVLAPLQTTTAETNQPDVSENEAQQVHNTETDGDATDGNADVNEDENGRTDESSDLGGLETTNDDDASAQLVHFEDESLESAIAKVLGIQGRAITTKDMEDLYELDVSNSNITSLKGLEHASNLQGLNAQGNNIVDISALKNLFNVYYLDLSNNHIESFDSLVGLTNLRFLYLDNNHIFSVPNNLNSIPNLENLTLSYNKLTDISNLKGLNDLTYLDLSYNNIEDITVLQELDYNKGLDFKIEVLLKGIEITDTDTIAELRHKGIEVHYDKDYEQPEHGDNSENSGTPGGHDGTPGSEDDDTTPDSNDGSGQVTPEPELEKAFPKNKGYVVSSKYVLIEVGNQQPAELSAAQVKTLKDNNLSIVIDRHEVDLIIPSSIFDTDENVEVFVKKLADVDGSFSSFKFTIKQGGNIVSKFKEPITLSFEIDATKATNPNNLKVFYLNEDTGEWELIGGTYNNGVVTATTDHFSTFAVFEVENERSAGPDTKEPADQNDEEKGQVTVAANNTDGGNQLPNTATNSFNVLLLGAFFIAAGVITFCVRPKRVKAK